MAGRGEGGGGGCRELIDLMRRPRLCGLLGIIWLAAAEHVYRCSWGINDVVGEIKNG